jgi:hypothetical protein
LVEDEKIKFKSMARQSLRQKGNEVIFVFWSGIHFGRQARVRPGRDLCCIGALAKARVGSQAAGGAADSGTRSTCQNSGEGAASLVFAGCKWTMRG